MDLDEMLSYFKAREEKEQREQRDSEYGYSKMTDKEEEDLHFNESSNFIGLPNDKRKQELFDMMMDMANAFYKQCDSSDIIKEDSCSKLSGFVLASQYTNKIYSRANQIDILLNSEKTITIEGTSWSLRSIDIVYHLQSNRKLTFCSRIGDYGDSELIVAYNERARYMNFADIEYALKHLKSLRKVIFGW